MMYRKSRSRSIPFLFVLCAAAALVLFPAALHADDDNPKNDLERDYVALTKVGLDSGSAIRLDNFVLKRDCLEVTFKSGTLYFSEAVEGVVTGAVFVGSGRMKAALPDDIEREQLDKYIEKTVLDEPFSNAFFRFDDDTASLFTVEQGAGGGSAAEARDLFKNRGEALRNLKNNVEFDILTHRISGMPYGGTFYGEFDTAEHGWVSFSLVPDSEEEVFIFQHTKAGASGSTRKIELWCQFDQLADLDQPESVRWKQNKDDIDVAKCTMDLTIRPNSLVLDNTVHLEVVSRRDGLGSIRFAFLHEGVFGHPGKVEVSSLTDSAGRELEYVHRNHEIIVRLAQTINEGDRETFSFVYEGDIIAPIFILGGMAGTPGGRMPAEFDFLPTHPVSYQLLNTYPWYPQYGYLRRSHIDWTVRVPKPNLVVVSGDTVRSWEEEDHNCIQTTFDAPVMLPSILFGEFHMVTNADTREEGAPIINVYSLAKQKTERDKILDETVQIVKYLESLYGPYPYKELDIAQMSFFMGFGQAPPGLVQLTGEAFLTDGQMSTISNFGSTIGRSQFLAHEVGHQWWAHVVGWRTYHDQWLSEAFTEYSSAMYMNVLEGPSGFQEDMDGWWDNAMQLKEAGPISLGGRLGGRDFVYSLYDKGPYVVHMLRMALVAEFGPDEGTTMFITALRNFLMEYRHKNPTTTDLQRVVNKTVGRNMDWFFDQWFRGSGIPKMYFSYDVRATEDGKWLLEGRIRQEDQKNAVMAIMPIYYEFGRKQFSDQVLFVNKPDFTFRAKLPAKPKKVVLNKSEDLLAEIVKE